VDGAREDLQRIAMLVETNRERMESLEQQMGRLESVRMDQMSALNALESIPEEGTKGSMVPLGAGVQIATDIPADAGAVVDIGSGIQVERTREEAKAILAKRNEELEALMGRMRAEFDDIEAKTIALANEFNEKIAAVEGVAPEPPAGAQEPEPEQKDTPKKARRRRGTDLTLDD
jgi:prefoldin alpha subunit